MHRLPRRRCQGSAELFGVLLLMALAVTVLAQHHRAHVTTVLVERDEAAGRLLAAWFLAAHRAVQEGRWTGARELPLRDVPAPTGLRSDQRIRLGVIDDGNGVAMAFGVFTPRGGEAIRHVRSGAIDAGLSRLEEAGITSGPMARHSNAIEAALGDSLQTHALYLTADNGLRWRNGVLHRRPQPGRPWLSRMEGGLDAGAFSIRDTGTTRAVAVMSALSSAAGSAHIAGSLGAASLEADRLVAGGLAVPRLTIARDLAVGRLSASATLAAVEAEAINSLASASLETDRVAVQKLLVGSGVTVSGAATWNNVVAGSLAAPAIRTTDLTTRRLFGPRLRVSGTLAADSCQGC